MQEHKKISFSTSLHIFHDQNYLVGQEAIPGYEKNTVVTEEGSPIYSPWHLEDYKYFFAWKITWLVKTGYLNTQNSWLNLQSLDQYKQGLYKKISLQISQMATTLNGQSLSTLHFLNQLDKSEVFK